VRPFIVGPDARPEPSGESAYRVLVPADALLAHKHPLVATGGLVPRVSGAMGGVRRIIAYPVRNGALLNLVCYVRALDASLGLALS
jgi:hypothetical protein